jgi:hypothetical protein
LRTCPQHPIATFESQSTLYGGYLSLRYCARSRGLLAIERWAHTVCIEMSALSGLSSETGVLAAFELAAAQMGGAIHWGQLNNRVRADIEATFPDTIGPWRRALARTAAHGNLATFDNDFCRQRGLEVEPGTPRGPAVDILLFGAAAAWVNKRCARACRSGGWTKGDRITRP